jgi:uncharacterized repeat protein (TIGR03803 family)
MTEARFKTLAIHAICFFVSLFAIMFAIATPAVAQQEVVLADFSNPEGGPGGGVILDAAGNLYGNTNFGGTYGGGSVFELLPTAGGGWEQEMLYSFDTRGPGGFYPVASLIFDAAGNLYGTAPGNYDGRGDGCVFRLSRQADGDWTETVLHSFTNKQDGIQPGSAVIFDKAGNLYGVTNYGGAHHYGTAYQLAPQADGSWKETILHSFGNSKDDGQTPYASLTLDAAGRVYGSTLGGGTYGNGTVFELAQKNGGGWDYRILYEFPDSVSDGGSPYGSLTFDASGNLYGTAGFGGADDRGLVFKLSPEPGGTWTETVLYSFNNSSDGGFPTAGVIFDAAGNLYGTTYAHGPYNSGSVFELSPAAGGSWMETLLYTFTGKTDGGTPGAGVVLDNAGNLFGTTEMGGTGYGTVFEILR